MTPPYVLLPLENEFPGDYFGLDGLASEPHRYLAAAMSDLSEECWCAGWLSSCEWDLLDRVEGRCGPQWGMSQLSPEQLDNLRSIRAACGGGWVAFGPDGMVALRADEIDAARAAWEGLP